MRGRRQACRAAASLVVLVLVTGCADNSEDAETAATLCNELRDVDNRIVDLVNASVEDISTVPVDARLARILDGADDVVAELQAWDGRIDAIEFPDIGEAAELREELHAGVDAALAELDDQRRVFESGPSSVPDEEIPGVVGTWFNAIEKVFSVSEPEIFRFERTELKQAFLDEPDCRNVIQQFVND